MYRSDVGGDDAIRRVILVRALHSRVRDHVLRLALNPPYTHHPVLGPPSMAKKKKPTLKPVARVFATTSQPKKAEPEPEEEEAPQDAPALTDGAAQQAAPADALGGATSGAADDWDKEVDAEQERLQGYVERLQDKGDKEVNRIVKVGLGSR